MDFGVDRKTRERNMFYLDLVVIGIFIVSIILTIRHTFVAGQAWANGDWGIHTSLMWLVVADAVFLTGSLFWILVRFFRNEYQIMTRKK